MAQLNVFSGGLNTRLKPHLLGPTDSVVNINVNMDSGCLVPEYKDRINTDVESIGKEIIFFKDKWVSSSEDINFVVFQEKLYKTHVGVPQKSNDGITWYNLGIAEPTTAPVVSQGAEGLLDGTYQYCYTYYNTSDGTESKPTPYSVEIPITLKQMEVSVIASTDPQVDAIRLYRLGGVLPSMTLVTTLTNTTQTYIDNIIAEDVDGHVLDSFSFGQAPSGLRYLTENNAMLF
jgi:hypothetical protein